MSSFTLDEMMPLVSREAMLRRSTLLGIFVVVSLLLLAIAFAWPKKYTSSVTLFVDNSNIVKPLLEGVAASGDQRDKAKVAKEVLFSHEIMEQVLDQGNWVGSDASQVERARIKEEIAQRTSVDDINSTLLVISHEHQSPKVAFDTTRVLADLFLDKTMRAQSLESSDAFEFIVSQVETYRGKLEDSEKRLERFKGQYPGARPGTEENVDQRIIELRRQLEKTELQYAEMNSRKQTLQRELSSESSTLQQQYRESQISSRVAELQAQIDVLRLSYTDDYPDIVRLNQQIQDYTNLAQSEADRRTTGSGTSTFTLNNRAYTGSSNLSPVYQALRADLARASAETDSLRTTVVQTKALLNKELKRATQSTTVERELAELSRDYQINKDIYEDLVKRRESARVSMSLGREKQGVLYRIQEQANFPVLPSGLRFMHIATLGLLLGAILPFVFLLTFLKLDPRIRTNSAITDDLELPLLTVVPHMKLPGEKESWIQKKSSILFVVLGVLLLYAVVGFIKYSQGVG